VLTTVYLCDLFMTGKVLQGYSATAVNKIDEIIQVRSLPGTHWQLCLSCKGLQPARCGVWVSLHLMLAPFYLLPSDTSVRSTHKYASAHKYAHKYACTLTHMRVYTYTHTHITHAYTHKHTHTHPAGAGPAPGHAEDECRD